MFFSSNVATQIMVCSSFANHVMFFLTLWEQFHVSVEQGYLVEQLRIFDENIKIVVSLRAVNHER